jgi:hypothetical protein
MIIIYKTRSATGVSVRDGGWRAPAGSVALSVAPAWHPHGVPYMQRQR